MSQKLEFVMRSFTKEQTFTDLCKEFGISTKTGYKWKERFLQDGYNGLKEKSRKPKKNSKEFPEETVCELIRIKKAKPRWGPKKVLTIYSNNHPNEILPSRSTVERILKKAGFVESKKRKRKSKSERIQNKIIPKKPNDLWTVDFKGWWYTPEREKCEPLTVRDEFSKYILSIKILKKADIPSVKQEFERIFTEFGLPKIIRSDNGPPFASALAILGLTRLATWWMSLGIKLDRIKPASPYQNGAHERLHLDISKELEGKISGNLNMHQQAFNVWRNEFNNERPHESLNMKTPNMVYSKSEVKFNGSIEYIEYPGGYISRQVNHRGYIQLKGRRIFLSNTLAGYNVGLKTFGNKYMELWFDDNHLGEIDLKTFVFKSIMEK